MFWLIRFSLRTIIKLKIITISFAAGMGIAYALQLREQYRSWGLVPADVGRSLGGDDLVEEPLVAETRSLLIEASPSQVWPWLVQLGYGRGGWYGYSQLERPWNRSGGAPGKSAHTILEEFQDLAEGDIVPTSRKGGFVARIVEPERSLVLYLDDTIFREQVQAAIADSAESEEASEEAIEALEDTDLPAFAVSWAFVLEPLEGGRTRFVERLRLRIDALSDVQRAGTPLLALAVFALMRRQMLGLKSRVEQGSGREA